jgi:hypothetical protein
VPAERLRSWYRRFVDTRSGDASERVLATAAASGAGPAELAGFMGAAVTDHLFIDGGHSIDFTNKAFEALDHLGWDRASKVLCSLAHQTAAAARAEETGEWRHPYDLPTLLAGIQSTPPSLADRASNFDGDAGVDSLAWTILGDDPSAVIAGLNDALERGASGEELARAVAFAAALRLTRFHTQNDHGDWDVSTMASRRPTPCTSCSSVHRRRSFSELFTSARYAYSSTQWAHLRESADVPRERRALCHLRVEPAC